MKKNVLCVFSLIFLALVTCTLLSMKIEDEMLLEVIGYEKKEAYSTLSMPSDMYFVDDVGMRLYEVYEGTGWESGLRAREVQLDSAGYFMTDRDYIIVRGASRQPVYGELAELYDGKDTAPATYLAVYPNGIPEENKMLFQAEILEQSDHVLLLYVENATQPFMENRAKGGLVQLKAGKWKIYSLEAVTQLLENVPMSMVAIVLLFALVVIGINTSLLARNLERNKVTVCVNGILILGMMAGLVWAFGSIDLPASMLPSTHIFDISHYKSLLGDIYTALEELNSETTRSFNALREQTLDTVSLTLTVGIAASAVVALVEQIWSFRKAKRERVAY